MKLIKLCFYLMFCILLSSCATFSSNNGISNLPSYVRNIDFKIVQKNSNLFIN